MVDFFSLLKKWRYSFCLLFLITTMLLGGMIAVQLGKELSWDLANYHYYNPFSYLYERGNIDYWPSSFIHVYFTPTLDFLTYFLITDFSPKLAVFMLGCIHGINLFLLFAIAYLVISQLSHITYPRLTAISISLLGLYGPTSFPGIGSFQHDNLVSLFILSFIYLTLKFFVQLASQKTLSSTLIKYFSLGSLLLGIGIGCKLTAGLFAGGALCAFLLLPLTLSTRIKLMFTLGIFVSLGILLSSGYWMFFLWHNYHNPVFPLWNEIFQSPYFPLYNWRDTRFLPKNIWQTLFYPFYFSFDGRTNDIYFRDFRFAILYLVFIAYALRTLAKNYVRKIETSLSMKWLSYFFIFSYILWQQYFSIMRYIVTLEMLTPLLIFLFIDKLYSNTTYRFATLTLIYFTITITTVLPQTIRAPWYTSDYFNIKLPDFVRNAPKETVLVAFSAQALNSDPRPQTYLIPFFPKKWKFIGIAFMQNQYSLSPDIISLVNRLSLDHLYLLSSDASIHQLLKAAHHLGFKGEKTCEKILSDRQKVTYQSTWLCLVKR